MRPCELLLSMLVGINHVLKDNPSFVISYQILFYSVTKLIFYENYLQQMPQISYSVLYYALFNILDNLYELFYFDFVAHVSINY